MLTRSRRRREESEDSESESESDTPDSSLFYNREDQEILQHAASLGEEEEYGARW
jgi:hypothetical protein